MLSDVFWGDLKKYLFTPDREPVPDYCITIFSKASQYPGCGGGVVVETVALLLFSVNRKLAKTGDVQNI